MHIPLELPLDSNGFLRRECPSCHKPFKWHAGPANEEAEGHPPPPSFFCPMCGKPAGPEEWMTQEQQEYARNVAMPALMKRLDDELGAAFNGLNSQYFSVETRASLAVPDTPMPLSEPDDMAIIASPCHSYEPVKVSDDAKSPFYCLVCGAAFAA